MSQHDYDIANQAGSLHRADLNSLAGAIRSCNSGASEPASKEAYMLWADTTSGFLKQRNSTNTAWVTVYRLATAGGVREPVTSKSGTYTVVEADFGLLIRCTTTLTLNLTAASVLGDGFWFEVRNTGGGTVTIDPNSTEQIDGATTVSVVAGASVVVVCDGSAFTTTGGITTSFSTALTITETSQSSITATSGNTHALALQGSGSGHGLYTVGGSTGFGVVGYGGPSGGHGLQGQPQLAVNCGVIGFSQNANFYGQLGAANQWSFYGNQQSRIEGAWYASDFQAFSDKRMKKNIRRIRAACDKINTLRGVSFKWRGTGRAGVGVIAQEVRDVIPEAVVDSDGTLCVSYGPIIGYLIEAVKEILGRLRRLELEVRKR